MKSIAELCENFEGSCFQECVYKLKICLQAKKHGITCVFCTEIKVVHDI